MLPFGVTIPASVPQKSEIPQEFINYPVFGAYCEKEKVVISKSAIFPAIIQLPQSVFLIKFRSLNLFSANEKLYN
jgi:hypothetical protein